MAAASLLTLLALVGVAVGILLGHSRFLSHYLTAAGGGLLFGISIFWLLPEIAALSGWSAALLMTATFCAVLILIDRRFLHSSHLPIKTTVLPILLATAIHSFVDGWSIRALQSLQLGGLIVLLGLALHKVPEGAAIGWIVRRSTPSHPRAFLSASAAELFTMVGAIVEPYCARPGFAAFGNVWLSTVLAFIGGSFLFVGIHAVLPNRARVGVVITFGATLLLVGTASLVKTAAP